MINSFQIKQLWNVTIAPLIVINVILLQTVHFAKTIHLNYQMAIVILDVLTTVPIGTRIPNNAWVNALKTNTGITSLNHAWLSLVHPFSISTIHNSNVNHAKPAVTHAQIVYFARLAMQTIHFQMILINPAKMEAHAFWDVMTCPLIGIQIMNNANLDAVHQTTMTHPLSLAKTVLRDV